MKPSERIRARAKEMTSRDCNETVTLFSAILEYLDETHSPAQAKEPTAVPPEDDEAGAAEIYAMVEHLLDFSTPGYDNRGDSAKDDFRRAYRFAKSRGEAVSSARIRELESKLAERDVLIAEYQSANAEASRRIASMCKTLLGGTTDGVLECDPEYLAEFTMEKLAEREAELHHANERVEDYKRAVEARDESIAFLDAEFAERKATIAAYERDAAHARQILGAALKRLQELGESF